MDIEALRRKEVIDNIGGTFQCIEECSITLVGFEESLRADIVAISKSADHTFIFAFEVKEPTGKWELKHWLKALRQAGNYPNCRVTDERAGSACGAIINASFLYPGPNIFPWNDQDSQLTRFYRNYDVEPLRGAVFLAQHFKVGIAYLEADSDRLTLKLGTDPVWDSSKGFRVKSEDLLRKRSIGSTKREIS
jgi:hypothetical protein